MNQKLVSYINDMRERGFSDKEIKDELITGGWSEKQVYQALDSMTQKKSENSSLSAFSGDSKHIIRAGFKSFVRVLLVILVTGGLLGILYLQKDNLMSLINDDVIQPVVNQLPTVAVPTLALTPTPITTSTNLSITPSIPPTLTSAAAGSPSPSPVAPPESARFESTGKVSLETGIKAQALSVTEEDGVYTLAVKLSNNLTTPKEIAVLRIVMKSESHETANIDDILSLTLSPLEERTLTLRYGALPDFPYRFIYTADDGETTVLLAIYSP